MKNFFIYKSSAGSGKTYTLVKEYLKLAFSKKGEFRRILAVTFTNKAAEEMKTRIISSLAALSKGEDSFLEELLLSEGVKGNISQKANDILQDILHNYSFFSVSTIDSFFHKIIRGFSKELKLQLGYNIELDQNLVIDKITEELLEDITENKDLAKYIEDYVFYSIDDSKGWKIDFKIKELASEIFKERYWIKKGDGTDLADNREMIKDFISTLFAIINDFEGRMKKYSEEAEVILNDYSLAVEDFPYGKTGFMNYLINKIRNNDYDPKQRVIDAASDINKWFGKKSKPDVRLAADNGLFDILQNTIKLYNTGIKNYVTSKELVKTIYVLGIYKDLLDKLKTYRDENKLMLISDTNNILMKVISGDNSPFIYEKIGSHYKHFLIDEFQDTSTFQWKNFLPLVQNSISENNFSMIVGDVKQSIYRWRNGNMKLLLKDVYSDLSEFEELIEDKFLNENYRSKKEIIKFNNSFFRAASEKLSAKNEGEYSDLILNTYKDTLQEYKKSPAGGYINITFIKSDEQEDTDARLLSINNTIEKIKEALDDGFKEKDIMILTRNNSDGNEAAYYLLNAGYRVVSSDSLLLTNSPKVKLLVNLLKYITDNKNYIAKTEVLYNYVRYFNNSNCTEDEIFSDYKNAGDSLFNKLLPEEFFNPEDKTRLKPELFSLNIYELAEKLISIFSLNNNTDAYLLRFLDAIREYSLKNRSDITGFIEWWEENKHSYSIIIPSEEDAIRVMTIHKAKGLQSRVVIMPYTNWDIDIKGNRDLLWASSSYPPFNESSAYFVRAVKNLKQSYFEDDYNEESALVNLDNLNLLYVAFTRAIERLYVNIPAKGSYGYNTGKLISETLNEPDFKTGFTNSNYFETGEKQKNKNKPKGNIAAYKTDSFVSSDHLNKTVIDEPAKEIIFERQKKYNEQKNRGVIIHKALARIKQVTDVENTVKQLIAEGLITSENEEDFYYDLAGIFKIKEVKSWFDNDYNVKTESEILLPDGNIYKPDRVLLKDKKAIIIDYKTGRQRKEHTEQINQYSKIISQMGYEHIEKYLFYVPEKTIVKV